VKAGAEEGGNGFRGHPASSLLGIAAAILDGEVMRANDDVWGAIEILEEAAEIERGLRYDEPEPLNFALRQWLGDALEEAGQHQRAVDVYREELEDHPHNGWSLFGLERALRSLGKDAEADAVHTERMDHWGRSDTYIRSPIF
jgi:tetratricopeptide (TPR) repeat protein